MAFGIFALLSLIEQPEPNWNEMPEIVNVVREEKFDLDENIISEIERVWNYVEKTVKYFIFLL